MQSEQRVNILLVDDHPENLMALEAILGDLGQNLVKANSGIEALRSLLTDDFAVILLDVQMPGMDGFETASLIRERDKLQHTPIIFLTAMDKSDTNIFRGYSVGAVDYMFKPFAPEVLKAKVSVFIDLFRKTEEVKRQTEMLRQVNRELGKTNKAIGGLYNELERKNLEVQTERDFVSAVIDTAGSLVFICDTDGRVVRINRAVEQASGFSATEVVGRRLWDLYLMADEVDEVKGIFRRVQGGESPIVSENCWLSSDGRPKIICWTTTALADEHGNVTNVIGTGLDITERKGAEEQIRRLNTDLERRVLERTAQLQDANRDLEGEIIERKRMEQALRDSEARFRRLAESNMIGVQFSDLDGTVIEANDAFLEIIGYDRHDLVSGQLRGEQLTPVEYRELDRAAIEELQTIRVCRPYEKEYLRKDGTRVPILIGRALLEGSQQMAVAFVLNLTQQKSVELQLKQAKESAEAANNAKDQFLAVLSHELRTPLTPVLTTVQVLEEEPGLPDDLRLWIDIIKTNVELEARLIDDLLDLTRITQGKLRLNIDTVDVHALLRSVMEICRGDIQEKQLGITLDLFAEHLIVRGDSARLQQVFWNLIKNSIKFTPSGGRVTIATHNNDAHHITVTVSDTGIGIDPEILPRIFDAFEQGDRNITRHFGGLGLGLAISKTLIDVHGGTISAASRGKGKGAIFTVGLELSDQVMVAEVKKDVPAVPMADGANVSILLVEDNDDTSHVIKHLLERQGYIVQAVNSMGRALEATEASHFDLLISDIGLPDGSGIELMQTLRDRKPIRGIAVSGFGMEEDIRRSHEAGFSEHLTKPINFKQLHEALQRLIACPLE
ncbi:MAG: response regulator [Candidatus Kapaibacterium sp.]